MVHSRPQQRRNGTTSLYAVFRVTVGSPRLSTKEQLTRSFFHDRAFDQQRATISSVEDFIRCAYGQVTVFGDYIYIDGGYISRKSENGGIDLFDPLNSPVSIPLSTSWSTINVVRRSIPKPAPKTSWPAVRADTSTGVFYS